MILERRREIGQGAAAGAGPEQGERMPQGRAVGWPISVCKMSRSSSQPNAMPFQLIVHLRQGTERDRRVVAPMGHAVPPPDTTQTRHTLSNQNTWAGHGRQCAAIPQNKWISLGGRSDDGMPRSDTCRFKKWFIRRRRQHQRR